jgi:hypothetical protein
LISSDNCIIDAKQKTLLYGCSAGTLPNNAAIVTKIHEYAFEGMTEILKMVVHNNFVSIG